jgi:sec-independent protein translocase protein TatC
MDRHLSITEHLDELRKNIIISLVSLGAAVLISVPFAPSLLKILRLPAAGVIEKLAYFSPEEAFLIYMRISFFAGITIAFPVLMQQLWSFLSPAVDDRYRKYIKYFIFLSLALFSAGCLFAYFVLIPPALKFLLGIGRGDLEPVISAGKYISFITSIILYCGVIFQMPLLSLILSRIGLIDHSFLRRKSKFAIVGIFIIAAVITPTTDVFNMLMLALPMLLLYEISIWVAFFAARKRKAVLC